MRRLTVGARKFIFSVRATYASLTDKAKLWLGPKKKEEGSRTSVYDSMPRSPPAQLTPAAMQAVRNTPTETLFISTAYESDTLQSWTMLGHPESKAATKRVK